MTEVNYPALRNFVSKARNVNFNHNCLFVQTETTTFIYMNVLAPNNIGQNIHCSKLSEAGGSAGNLEIIAPRLEQIVDNTPPGGPRSVVYVTLVQDKNSGELYDISYIFTATPPKVLGIAHERTAEGLQNFCVNMLCEMLRNFHERNHVEMRDIRLGSEMAIKKIS